jgi:hypothetical protein
LTAFAYESHELELAFVSLADMSALSLISSPKKQGPEKAPEMISLVQS